jgi:hypothetical protein
LLLGRAGLRSLNAAFPCRSCLSYFTYSHMCGNLNFIRNSFLRW